VDYFIPSLKISEEAAAWCDAQKMAYLFSEVFSRNSVKPNSLRMTNY